MPENKLILGPPGTGKTTTLLEVLEEEIQGGTPVDRIAFVSFTKKGAYEGRDRIMEQFGYSQRELPWFRTLHSIAFKWTGASSDRVIQREHYKEIANLTGFPFRGFVNEDDPYSSLLGDTLNFVCGYARNIRKSLEETWRLIGRDLDWMQLKYFNDTFEEYKQKFALIDFTDMIEQFVLDRDPIPVDVAIIDEAQDLSKLQWEMVRIAFRNCQRIYIAGDDDQAIYQWSGADVDSFLSIQGSKQILAQSHRIPKTIHQVGQSVSSKIVSRYTKVFRPKEEAGHVELVSFPDLLQFNDESWLLLARNRYLLDTYIDEVRLQGYPYTTKSGGSVDPKDRVAIYTYERLRKGKQVLAEDAQTMCKALGHKLPLPDKDQISHTDVGLHLNRPWFDALVKMPPGRRAYYQAILRNGGNLARQPNIHIDTIHGVKGGEADNVAVMSDISFRTKEGMDQNPDAEHRVFYVGVTRARKNLFIIRPQTDLYYRF